MNEEIEIQKQLDNLRDRVKFIREYVVVLNKATGQDISPVSKFELLDKIYDLENEANHKEYMIKMRENDMKMYEQQRQQITKQVNDEFGGLIKELRTKIFPSTKDTTIADGIIKRFSKNDYASNEAKVQDFVMAKQLLK